MDTAVIQQFLNFFQDYIDLCQSQNWPDNDTSETELKNAFIISQHVEKCLDKLQKKGVINEFLSVLHNNEDISNNIFKNSLSDPPKYILKKIINSNTKIVQMDVGFKLFLELFSEDRLEKCLTELMLEAASKETLLQNLSNEIPKNRILKFKSDILLTELTSYNLDTLELFNNCNQAMVELLVVSLLNNEQKYVAAVKQIADAFLSVVVSEDNTYKSFWRQLLKVDDKYFLEMCLENSDIFMYVIKAVSDCGKLLKEGMSAESFYIDLGQLELENVVKRICSNHCLKSQFFEIVKGYDSDINFWENML